MKKCLRCKENLIIKEKNKINWMRDFNQHKTLLDEVIYDNYEMKSDKIYKRYIRLSRYITFLRIKISKYSIHKKNNTINKFNQLLVYIFNLFLNIYYEEKKFIDEEMKIFFNGSI